MVYRKRMLEKFYEVYGGPTPFEEPVDDIKLYPETYKECLKEQDTLQNKKIATVSQNGIISGKKKGTTYICCKIGKQVVKKKIKIIG